MKYEIHASIKWTIKSQSSKKKIEEQAVKNINAAFSKSGLSKFEIEIISKAQKKEAKTLKDFSWNYIKNKIHNANNSYQFKFGKKNVFAKMNPHRYFLFKENNKCVCCGIEGKKILIEKNPTDQTPHLNLYAQINNELILLTKDHIKPKCLGGMDTHSNYQTMCIICNSLKGHSNMRISDLSSLRKIYDKNRGKPKKVLHEIIENERAKLTNPWKMKHNVETKNFSNMAIETTVDLSIYKNRDGKFTAKSIFEKVSKNHKYIGNIRKHMIFEPLFVFKNFVECQIGNHTLISISRSLIKNYEDKNGAMGN